MVLDLICSYPTPLVMGAASLVGALAYAIYSVSKKRVEVKNFKFDKAIILDTMWQSTAAGAIAGLTLGCSWMGLFTAAVTGIGVDRIANKLKFNKVQFLNVAKLAIDALSKKK